MKTGNPMLMECGDGITAFTRARSADITCHHAVVPGRGRVILVTLAFVFLAAFPAFASKPPFTPTDDSTVIARLRPNELSTAERQLRAARSTLAATPTDLPLALDVARQAIRRARTEADPRFLGQAQVALSPWWTNPLPPVEVLVLRATIRQSLHDFPTALADLDAALAREPRHVGAWLTKATVHTVRGEFSEARKAASHLLALTDPLTATTAIAQIAALDGNAPNAARQLEAALQRAASPTKTAAPENTDTVVWAETVLGETLARLKQPEAAEPHFRNALKLAPADPYLLGAFADFLLDQGRAPEVLPLLRDHERADGLLLRLAEAQRAVHRGSEVANVTELRARFDAARARGDRLHLREEARFHLRLLGDFATARCLAEKNWEIQKEPADARLLEETEPENRR